MLPIPATQERYLRLSETCQIVGLSRSTLSKMCAVGTGPPFVRLNKATIRFPQNQLYAWLRSKGQQESA